MNKRGFTMVELLATITILGILAFTVIGSANFILNKSRENYYTSQKNSFLAASKSYFAANKSLLPKYDGESTSVTLADLQANKYIKDILDVDKKQKCYSNSSKVIVTKISKGNYKYKVILDCPSRRASSDSEEKITIIDLNKVSDTNNIFTYEVTADSAIRSYRYVVLKNGSTYLGPVSGVGNNSSTVQLKEFKVDTNEFLTTNTFTISVTVVGVNGGTNTKTSTIFDKNDTLGPKIRLVNGPLGDMTSKSADRVNGWANTGSQIFKFECEDVKGSSNNDYASGCVKDTVTLTINKSNYKTAKTKVQLTDRAGNLSNMIDISNLIRLDFDPPTVPTVKMFKWKNNDTRPTTSTGLLPYTDSTWYSGKVFTSPENSSTDAGIGGVTYQFTTTGVTENLTNHTANYRNIEAQGESTIKFRACDALKNCSNYSSASTIRLDRTAPTVSLSSSNNDWIIKAVAKDTGSKINKYGWDINSLSVITATTEISSSKNAYTPVGQSNVNVSYYAYDVAGNLGSNSVVAYKECSKTFSNSESRAYKVGSESEKHCSIDARYGTYKRPWRKYNFHFYECKCNYDSYTRHYCSYTSNKEVTGTLNHLAKYITLFYRNNDDGVKACKGEDSSHPRNSYIYDVCYEGSYEPNTPERTFHGYTWYNTSIPSGGYKSWSEESWYHDNAEKDNRVPYSSSTATACAHSCQIAGNHRVY